MIHADKWGPLGSAFAALCCLGWAPALAALSAAGLGFLIHDAILIPLLAMFLGITIWSLSRDHARHGRPGPERTAWGAALLVAGGLWAGGVIVAIGLAALVAATIWNAALVRRLRAPEPVEGT